LVFAGFGVVARETIPGGAFLFEYKGELIDEEEGELRRIGSGPGYLYFFDKRWYA
jgi:hypothetical protein